MWVERLFALSGEFKNMGLTTSVNGGMRLTIAADSRCIVLREKEDIAG